MTVYTHLAVLTLYVLCGVLVPVRSIAPYPYADIRLQNLHPSILLLSVP